MTTPDDPLLERLRQLPGARLDDVSAARTLARAEAAFASAGADAGIGARAPRARRVVPAALALWAVLYSGCAVRELGRLFPAAARSAVAAIHRVRATLFAARTDAAGSSRSSRPNRV